MVTVCDRCGEQIEPGTYHDPIPARILRGRRCAVTAIPRGSVTHYMDEDWRALCRDNRAGDYMWAFDDDKLTCPSCVHILRDDTEPVANFVPSTPAGFSGRKLYPPAREGGELP